MILSANGCQIDVHELRAGCRGRWPDIFASVCGIDRQVLDSRHHPCPRCGGKDRFRMIDADAGALFCNRCFNRENGDGIAAIRWLLGIDFRTACERIADYLHVPQTDGRSPRGNGMTPVKSKSSRKFGSWEEAVADTEQRMGKRAAEWQYHDSGGQVVGVVCRWDTPDGKEIRPFAVWADGSWTCGAPPELRPIYRLTEVLQSTGHVWIVEGEKTADALRQIGLTATTSLGGANAAKKSDWSEFAGREVIIWPDHDEPGQKYAADVRELLASLNPIPTIRQINPADLYLKNGEDAADWIGRHDAQTDDELREQLEGIIATAPVMLQPERNSRPRILTIRELVEAHRELRPPIVDGLLRQGETCNIVAAPKAGKSWLAYTLALSVATGRRWLGQFQCRPGKVLLIDNELHPELLASRIPAVAEAMGLRPEEFADQLEVLLLRGNLTSIGELGRIFRDMYHGQYALIVVDAMYRMLPDGSSENDNAMMAQVYNQIDRYAFATGAAFVMVHHSSKGDQSGKTVTDVGAGAGAQSRAADTHLVIRPHEEDGCAVIDAAVRSFAPIQPICIRWHPPLWLPADDIDPSRLKRQQNKADQHQQQQDADGFPAIVDAVRRRGQLTMNGMVDETKGIGKTRMKRLIRIMVEDGRLIESQAIVANNPATVYRLARHIPQ